MEVTKVHYVFMEVKTCSKFPTNFKKCAKSSSIFIDKALDERFELNCYSYKYVCLAQLHMFMD